MSGGMPGPAPDGRRNAQGIRVDPEVEAEPSARRAVISVLVAHEPGVLSEVSGLFSRRQFNIESLTVGPTNDPDRARITVVCDEPEPGVDQLKKQLRKLLAVVAVRELPDDAVRRELALVKVAADRPDRVAAVAEMYDGRTVDACAETATVEVTGSRQKVEAAVDTLDGRFGVHEVVRTGTTALSRGTDATTAAPSSERATDGTRSTERTGRTDGGRPPADGPTDRPTGDQR